MEKVAVIVSSAGQGSPLAESLDAICRQTRPPDEIIVVGPSGESAAVIDEFLRWRRDISLVPSDPAPGPAGPVSRALSLVTSAYVVWATTDQRLLPGFLEASMAALERHPEAGICFSETARVRDDAGAVQRLADIPGLAYIYDLSDLPEYMAPGEIVRRMRRAYLPITTSAVVVRRDALLAIGGYPKDLEWHADFFAHTAIALRYGACVVSRPLSLTRTTSDSYPHIALRDPVRQAPMLAAMLELLARPEYRDIRRAFRRCPSSLSPWGALMGEILLGRPRDWDLLPRYLAWKARDYKVARRLTWAGTVWTLALRLFSAVSWRTRAAFSGALASEVQRLRAEAQKLRAEGEHLQARLTAISEVRSELEARLNAVETRLDAAAAERDRLEERLRATADGVDEMARRLADAERERDQHRDALDGCRSALMAIRLPPMLVTTMPKSGTYYVSKLFAEGLGIETRIVSHQYFPHDVIRQPELRILSHGNCISQDHFGASRINLVHVGKHVNRMVVHLRDPRQAMLSYVYFLDTKQFRRSEAETLLFIYPPLPDDYYELDFEAKLDWAIENWLPLLVEWAREWVEAAKALEWPRIKFTRYEDLVADQDAFVRDLLAFFDIPYERFVWPQIETDEEVHFRRGEIDEWKRVFTAQQIAAANSKIPPELAERFSWPT